MPRLLLPVLTLFVLTGCTPGGDGNGEITRDFSMLSECERPDEALYTAIYAQSLCGTVPVFENRAAGDGRVIDLNVMVIPALARYPEPDPFFVLAGGPGQAATDFGPGVMMRLNRIREDRDVVLVDQRGTGASNSLACRPAESDMPVFDETRSSSELLAISIQQMRDCLDAYDADTQYYTTPIAMDDLDEVRATLGYEQINLMGVSYGTRAALVYLRRHPDHARTAILDGVVPTTMQIPLNIAVDGEAALRAMFNDCANDTGCHRAFPDLEERVTDLLDRLAGAPEPLEIRHPRTGAPIPGTIDDLVVRRAIRGVLYDRRLTAMLPFTLTEASNGNWQPFVTLGYSFFGEDSPMSAGMMASVLCAEDMQRADTPNDEGTLIDNAIYRSLDPICEFWPVEPVAASYFEPVRSDIPVLLTSGTLDPVTPPRYAIEAEATLTTSQHIIVPGVGHGTFPWGCLPDLLAEFVSSADPHAVNASCVNDLDRPAFFLSTAGPILPTAEQDAETGAEP